MQAPKYTIKGNQTKDQDDLNDGLSSRNPSWCVCFIRFSEPASMYGGKAGPWDVEKPLIIENDCITVSVDRPKHNPFKTASIILKAGQLFYPGCVAPGDWAFVWMADHQDRIDRIVEMLNGLTSKGTKNILGSKSKLNDWFSGLKFIGRVITAREIDSVAPNGARTVATQVDCQAFVELSTAVYYTFVSKALVDPTLNSNPATFNPSAVAVQNGLDSVVGDLASKFLNFYELSKPSNKTPDVVIAALFAMLMGVENDGNLFSIAPELPGAFNTAIGIPKYVDRILGQKNLKYVYQIMNYVGGLQQYNNSGASNPWEQFSPSFKSTSGTILTEDVSTTHTSFFFSKHQCKGYIPYIQPPLWSNQSLWSIFNQYLNPVTNEMYTCLRVNHKNQILPTVVVREKPFGTNLYYQLKEQVNNKIVKQESESVGILSTMAENFQIKAKESEGLMQAAKADNFLGPLGYNPDMQTRAMYGNLPRWVIDESVVIDVQTSTDESARINFVQIFGQSANQAFVMSNVNPESYKFAQFVAGNYVADRADISRHGLKTYIIDNAFDYITGSSGTMTNFFARMNADWMFNGHLKLKGTVRLTGVSEPICEGDNCEVRGILYHIEGVHHDGAIDTKGNKSFSTVLQVSNGVIAASVSSDNLSMLPAYVYHRGTKRKNEKFYPGFTDMQLLFGHKGNRNEDGEFITTTDEDL